MDKNNDSMGKIYEIIYYYTIQMYIIYVYTYIYVHGNGYTFLLTMPEGTSGQINNTQYCASSMKSI